MSFEPKALSFFRLTRSPTQNPPGRGFLYETLNPKP